MFEPDATVRFELANAIARVGGRARSTGSADDALPIIRLESIDVVIWSFSAVDAPSLAPVKQLRALEDPVKRATPALALVHPQRSGDGRASAASVHLLRLFDDVAEMPLPAADIAQRVIALFERAGSARARTSGED